MPAGDVDRDGRLGLALRRPDGEHSADAFLNSAGVALLVRETGAHRRAGGRPELRNPSRAVLQVLRLTGWPARSTS